MRKWPVEYSQEDIAWMENFEKEEQKRKGKRSKSISALYLKNDPQWKENINKELEFDVRELQKIGGKELVVFYLCNGDFHVSGKELRKSPNYLRVLFKRIGKKLLLRGIDEEYFKNLVKIRND